MYLGWKNSGVVDLFYFHDISQVKLNKVPAPSSAP